MLSYMDIANTKQHHIMQLLPHTLIDHPLPHHQMT